MKLRFLTHARQGLLAVTYLAVASKLLIPAGYMPSALAEGTPIRLCSSGLPEGLVSHGDKHHDHDEEGSELLWEHCSLGALAATAAVTSDYEFRLPFFRESVSLAPQSQLAAALTVVAFHARAPPTSIL